MQLISLLLIIVLLGVSACDIRGWPGWICEFNASIDISQEGSIEAQDGFLYMEVNNHGETDLQGYTAEICLADGRGVVYPPPGKSPLMLESTSICESGKTLMDTYLLSRLLEDLNMPESTSDIPGFRAGEDSQVIIISVNGRIYLSPDAP
ncbi:hypothetical protein [Salinispira pacifica]|uniref:Uncharacterized protein n=1 Tax=Salinispira pacifica TaxID=1307761 RepID=V5WKH5_9SPIO|nr:hypothetical protein [Salinispira pacifica]AHC16253.1 hypothetical protein L21SP2_2905 [Salinispira pacifica]